MTRTIDLIHIASDAVAMTRVLGYDCRNIVVEQLEGCHYVQATQGKSAVAWNGQYFHYLGRPTGALAHFTHEFSQMAK